MEMVDVELLARAFVDEGTMIDTWATVGSCAQVGKNCHISGGAGLGGVLEPLQANPTIIEDNCFVGARSEVVEGVIVEENSVISMGVFIGQSTKIYDRATGEVTYGRVPSGSVVVSGSLPSADGKYAMQYSAGFVVHDIDRPHIVRYRSETPAMVPEGIDETHGIVNDVVFPTAICQLGDRSYEIYYGMADARIGRARLQLAAPDAAVEEPAA